jgi:hypothetical protein
MSTIKTNIALSRKTTDPITLTEQYIASTWLNHGSTEPNILDSFNVSSSVDNGIGDYTFNFIDNMVSSRYAVTGTILGSSDRINRFPTRQVDLVDILVLDISAGGLRDQAGHAIITGDKT